jgi:hypothetical protein
MNTPSKLQNVNGFDRAFRTFPELPGANTHRVADVMLAAWASARALAARAFDRTVPLDGTVRPDDHAVLSFSLSREAPEPPPD